jgi:hypothetical protein
MSDEYLTDCDDWKPRAHEASPRGRELLFFIRDSLFAEAAAVMEAKNSGYATADRPVLNYERAAEAAGCTTAQYMLGRQQEKITRMGVLLAAGRHDDVAEEFTDVINMTVLIAYAMEWERA